jgi:hypothetical protein
MCAMPGCEKQSEELPAFARGKPLSVLARSRRVDVILLQRCEAGFPQPAVLGTT